MHKTPFTLWFQMAIPVLLLFPFLFCFVSCGKEQYVADHPRYFDSIINQADIMPPDSAVNYLHRAYSDFPEPGPGDLYKKYEHLYYAAKKYAAPLIYADSMLYVLKGHEEDKEYAALYTIALLKRGEALANNQMYTEAYRAYLEARNHSKSVDSTVFSGEYYRELGNISKRFGKREEAVSYFRKLLKMYPDSLLKTSFEAFSEQIAVLLVIGNTYVDLKKDDSAIVYFNKAFTMNESYRGPNPDGGHYLDMTRALSALAISGVEYGKGEFKKAESLLKEAVRILDRTGYDRLLAQQAMARLGNLYFDTNQPVKTDSLLKVWRASLDQTPCEKHEYEWQQLSARYFAQKENFLQAYYHLSKYNAIKEEVDRSFIKEKDIDLSKEFEAIEKENEIDLLKKQGKQNTLYLLLISCIALMAIIITALIWRTWKQAKKNVSMLTQLNNQVSTQKNLLERSVKLQDISQSLSKTAGWEYILAANTLSFSRQANTIYDLESEALLSIEQMKALFDASEKRVMNSIGLYTIRKRQPVRLETEMHTARGMKKWVRIIAEPVISGDEVIGSIGAIQDITLEKQAEDIQRQLTNHLQTLMMRMEDIVFEIDGNRIFRNVWVRDEKLLFLPKAELIGKSMESTLGTAADIFVGPLDEVLLNGGSKEIEYRHIDPSVDRWYKAKIILIERSEYAEFSKIVVSVHDITPRKKQALALEETRRKLEQSNADKDRIMQVLIHDLRSPLSGIHTVSSMILQKTDYRQEDREMLEVISDTSLFLFKMVSELVDISLNNENRILKEERIDIANILQQAILVHQFKANEKSQQIRTEVQEKLLTRADAQKMQRIFNNLITNAIKFSPNHSTITVTAFQQQDSILIVVKDQGIGIPEGLRERIFDVFTSAKRVGTNNEKPFGLGLSISKQIAESHGGRIWFESEPDKGTEFFVEIPVKDA